MNEHGIEPQLMLYTEFGRNGGKTAATNAVMNIFSTLEDFAAATGLARGDIGSALAAYFRDTKNPLPKHEVELSPDLIASSSRSIQEMAEELRNL